ncbi:hypothetical protein TYRP_014956 [Tyrophagus putrescentiae]|nr:hypothetical protein TYRP_014956 [Tyrophagus putrescentiae]
MSQFKRTERLLLTRVDDYQRSTVHCAHPPNTKKYSSDKGAPTCEKAPLSGPSFSVQVATGQSIIF